jgi:hypothetical protein
MVVIEEVLSRGILSAKVIGLCREDCSISYAQHSFDLVGMDKWKVKKINLMSGDRLTMEVRRPFPKKEDQLEQAKIVNVITVHPKAE